MGITTNTHEGLKNTTGDLNIINNASDKHILLKGSDGGSTITALTLDMSDSGKAYFNSEVHIGGLLKIPSLVYHVNNLDTYFGFTADNTIKFFTSGSEALLLDSSQDATFAGDVTINGSTNSGAVTPRTLNFTTNPTNAGLSGSNEYLIGEIAFTGKDSSSNAAGKYARIRGSIVDGNTTVQGSGGEGGVLKFTLSRHDVGAQPRVEYDILTLNPTIAVFDGEVEATSLDINGNADISGNIISDRVYTNRVYINSLQALSHNSNFLYIDPK